MNIKFNWKILVAVIIVVGIFIWGVDSVRTRSYSGNDIAFGIGSGPVTVTNPSDDALSVTLIGSGTRSFAIVNSSFEITGSSVRDGTGRSATQVFEFDLPPGDSEFSIARGRDINFTASADAPIEANVQPLSAEDAQTTRIAVAVVIIGALFYISHATRHMWIKQLRHGTLSPTITPPVVAVASNPHGRTTQSFGDNRINKE